LWNITGVEWQKDTGFDLKTYGPVKIKTDACRTVNIWKLDNESDYLKETDTRVEDTCYWLHYSASSTTLGCIRIASPADAEAIARIIQRLLDQGEAVQLEVV
jgi:hypothetical protein